MRVKEYKLDRGSLETKIKVRVRSSGRNISIYSDNSSLPYPNITEKYGISETAVNNLSLSPVAFMTFLREIWSIKASPFMVVLFAKIKNVVTNCKGKTIKTKNLSSLKISDKINATTIIKHVDLRVSFWSLSMEYCLTKLSMPFLRISLIVYHIHNKEQLIYGARR